MDLIAPLLPYLGPGSLVAIAVLLMYTGRLVPRSTLRDVQSDRDAIRKELLATREADRQALADLAGQVAELTSLGRTTVALLSSLHKESAV